MAWRLSCGTKLRLRCYITVSPCRNQRSRELGEPPEGNRSPPDSQGGISAWGKQESTSGREMMCAKPWGGPRSPGSSLAKTTRRGWGSQGWGRGMRPKRRVSPEVRHGTCRALWTVPPRPAGTVMGCHCPCHGGEALALSWSDLSRQPVSGGRRSEPALGTSMLGCFLRKHQGASRWRGGYIAGLPHADCSSSPGPSGL